MEEKKTIDYSNIYDVALLNISEEEIDEKYLLKNHDDEWGLSLKTTKDEFLLNLKSCFIKGITNGCIDDAFTSLQQDFPLLAEYLILAFFEEKLLKQSVFVKAFIFIYTRAKKGIGKTLFTTTINNEKIIEMFTYCNRKTCSKNDANKFRKLPSTIQIFRGTAGLTECEAKNAVSWSLSKEEAKVFASKNHTFYKTKNCNITSAQILKKNVIMYLNSAVISENEIIINPINLIDSVFTEFNP